MCFVCEKRFSTQFNLNKHTIKKKKITKSNCKKPTDSEILDIGKNIKNNFSSLYRVIHLR
jgi:hypothetical protein